MVVVGFDYECIYVDVGMNGRILDGGVWNKCSLFWGLEDGSVFFFLFKCLLFGVV